MASSWKDDLVAQLAKALCKLAVGREFEPCKELSFFSSFSNKMAGISNMFNIMERQVYKRTSKIELVLMSDLFLGCLLQGIYLLIILWFLCLFRSDLFAAMIPTTPQEKMILFYIIYVKFSANYEMKNLTPYHFNWSNRHYFSWSFTWNLRKTLVIGILRYISLSKI